jgi:hypothetical protein
VATSSEFQGGDDWFSRPALEERHSQYKLQGVNRDCVSSSDKGIARQATEKGFGYYVLGLASALRLVSGVAVLHLDYTNDIELPSLLNSCDAQTLFFFGGFHSQI